MAGGRPTSYKPEFVDEAMKLCLLGATDNQLANFFEVCIATITNWKKDHPEFLASIKKAKIDFDQHISKSLFQRAKGYSHVEEKVFLHEGEPVIVPIKKYYPPDTTACIFWLKNRQPAEWRDIKHLEAKVKQEHLIETKEDLEKMLTEVDKETDNE